MGPIPVEGDVIKLEKRKQLSSVKEKNYLLISDDFADLKQNISFKFQALDFKEAMALMADIGNINILVGDEVAGSITAELDNVPWDKAFNALLDLKSYAADIDVASNIIRVSTPSNLTSQESYKSARASAVKKKVEIEDSVEPIISEIFRLYYITPAEAKATITELFTSDGSGGSFMPIQVTEEITTRSIIVRGKEKDLDIVDKVIREIDKRTRQVLIEAFIVEASSTFEQNLGKRLGFAYTRNRERIGGTQGGSTVGASGGTSAEISDNTGAFTSGAGTDNLIKPVDASLKLIVTPNIIGDGNVMLQIQVNNDTPNRSNPGTPGVNKMEINTKLLVADGDIVVIGGIKKNNVASGKEGVPGVSKLPVVGKALSGTSKSDTMNELLVFIAPRIL